MIGDVSVGSMNLTKLIRDEIPIEGLKVFSLGDDHWLANGHWYCCWNVRSHQIIENEHINALCFLREGSSEYDYRLPSFFCAISAAKRNGYRSGHYERNFSTTAGDVKFIRLDLLYEWTIKTNECYNPSMHLNIETNCKNWPASGKCFERGINDQGIRSSMRQHNGWWGTSICREIQESLRLYRNLSWKET